MAQPEGARNPAHLIRQARKSMVHTEEEVKTLPQRHRRASAPAPYAEPKGETFKTKCKACVRTLPSTMSLKIQDLPEGWKVVGAKPEASGWVAIEPRGYVQVEDLQPASPLPSPREPEEAAAPPPAVRNPRRSAPEAPQRTMRRTPTAEVLATAAPAAGGRRSPRVAEGARAIAREATPPRKAPANRASGARGSCVSPRPVRQSPRLAGGNVRTSASMLSPRMSAGKVSPGQGPSRASPYATPSPQACMPPRNSPQSQSPAVVEVLALKEEQVLLRESNVGLREQELEKRRELDELARAREAIAEEVKKLEHARMEMQEKKEEEQKELEKQQAAMKSKLEMCRDAVAFAVGSIDELYAQQDVSDRMSSSVVTCHVGGEGDSRIHCEELHNAKAMAQEAGTEVVELLKSWEEESTRDESTRNSQGNDQENTEISIISKKMDETSGQTPLAGRTPLSACNTGY